MKKVYSNNYFSELKRIANKINSLYPNWEEVPAKEKQSLINRLTQYYNRVKNKYSKRSLSKVLGVASIFISSIGFSQTFTTPVTNPFSISNNSAPIFSNELVDIDNDGDLDLFTVGDYYSAHNLYYQENTGTATAPVFGTKQTNPFSFPAGTAGYSYLLDFNLADIDNDGDYDLFAIDYYNNTLNYYENKGTLTVPLFNTLVTNPFRISAIAGIISDIADIDGDGDYDIVTLDGSNYKFYQNSGTSSAPIFSTAAVNNPFGIGAPSGYYDFVDFVDFDSDGDLDLFRAKYSSTTYLSDIVYQENTGTATAPVFGTDQINPFSLVGTTYGLAPEMVDIDNDGDLDLFLTVYYGPTVYFQNTSPPASINELSKLEISIFPVPTSDELTIKGAKLNSQFKIYSMDGKEVFSGILNSNKINVSQLEKGLYLFKLIQDDQQQSIRFTKI